MSLTGSSEPPDWRPAIRLWKASTIRVASAQSTPGPLRTWRVRPLAAVTVPQEPCTGSAGLGLVDGFGAAGEFGASGDGIGGTETPDTPDGTKADADREAVTVGGGASPEQAESRPAERQAASKGRDDLVEVETRKAILSSAGRDRPILAGPGPLPWH